jgi:hypothetical protein
MTTAEQQRETIDEAAVFAWRFSELLRAGYSAADATMLAGDRDVDLRLAERLLGAGCPSATALRILL